MRQDMHRLTAIRSLDICGQRKLHSRGVARDLEVLPTHQSMRSSVPHYSYPRVMKLTPALRWLHRQATRPWNDVYAELRKNFDSRNVQQGVVLERLLGRVERDVFFEDGKPRVRSAYGSYAVSDLYVHPDTGILMDAKGYEGAAKERAQQREARRAEKSARRVIVTETRQLHLLDGLWFWVEIAPVTAPKTNEVPALISAVTGKELVPAHSVVDIASVCRDVLTGQQFHSVPTKAWETAGLLEAYGKPAHYAKRKWQASRKDVDRYVNVH